MTTSKDTSNNNVLIIALVALASVVIAAIVALAVFGSPDNAIVSSAIGQIVTLVTLIAGVLVTLKATNEAKAAGIESVAASKENAQTLAAVSVQQGHALEAVSQKQDTTNKLVDGHLSGMTAQIAALMQTVARLETDKAVKQVEMAQIISAIPAAVPAPSTGATTPLGTPVDSGTTIEPGGPTVINLAPDADVTIQDAEQQIPKGKRPLPGEQM